MRLDQRLGWWGLVLVAALGLAACGGGAERDDEDDDRSLTGASSVIAPGPQPESTTSPEPGTPTAPQPTPEPTPVSVAFEQDIRPILQADCVRCHGQLGTYSGAMGWVQPGSASSALVRATQSGGRMFGYLTGDVAGKAELIRRWVVENGAAETR